MPGWNGTCQLPIRPDTQGLSSPSLHKFLRHAAYLWADLSRARSPWAQAFYQQQRCRGRSHACAIRALGQRWLKILWKMWISNTSYNPDFHTKNQIKHGSWVLKLLTPDAPIP